VFKIKILPQTPTKKKKKKTQPPPPQKKKNWPKKQ